jgi:MFS family permease
MTPQTIASPETEPRAARGGNLFQALAYRDFRLLWSGLLVSNLGTWMQFTALGYHVVALAGNDARKAALYLGYLGLSRAIPALVCSPIAGVVADTQPRRRVLLMTNITVAAIASIYAILIARDAAPLGIVLVLSAFQAGVQAFDSPARQSWVPLLVPREIVGNAIGLNSIAFNAPSVVGPPIAGLLIAASGTAFAFGVNAVATLAVVLALIIMKPAAPSERTREPMLQSIAGGIAFMTHHPILRWVALVLVVSALFVRPYTFVLPAYAAHVVHVDARGLGFLLAASGAGAIVGAIITALVPARRRAMVWFASASVMSLGVIALGATTNGTLAFFVLAITGLATLSFIGSSNVFIQTLAPDDMRGRAISVYSMILLGLVPAGSLVIGALANAFDLRVALAIGGACAFATTVVAFVRSPLRRM